ncbi:probable receptor-like serine/threonine-protein kinase At5g57670 isoform X2 [Olea europaea var. sylvestris]|uniref:probable receptor-like serine/threonine-protein kinase At5g57670 isoform X2 n=1 Tax=Olea europaea var. sylvestris TaxID=158386 RepID=UPI000C1D0930|nr:probable receptor-like serine/threonine-protein kinase At5g57670 isoform X2 [Olea europaea var. sylvestris]
MNLLAINQENSRMIVEQLKTSRKRNVLVGIRFDGHSKELLDWALVKVAHPGDCVVAVHVCQNSDSLSKVKTVLEDYLEDYQWLCNQKQATLSAEVFKGNSIGKVLVREAKNLAASIVIVGITKDGAIWGRTSIAKYCAKQLPSTTEVMAIHNGKVFFTRSSNSQLEGFGRDPRPSLYLMGNITFKDKQSELLESEPSEVGRLSDEDGGQSLSDEALNPVKRLIKGSWSSISLKVEDFSQEKPGWPLLQTSSSITQPAPEARQRSVLQQIRGSWNSISLKVEDFSQEKPGWPLLQTSSSIIQPAPEARQMSVVQWVMSLPNRSLLEASEFKSNLNETGDSLGIENGISEVNSGDYKMSVRGEEANHLKLMPVTKSSGCKWFSHELLKMSTSQFSSENLIGKGGCNSVYKGLLPGGKQVAIKTLISSKEARKNFTMEVDIMTTLKHKGITTLLGICVEDDNLISVYDFLPTGNLEENLQRNIKQNSMPWEVRFKIAVGIAEALKYLHDECPRPVIHRDIKSSNILLTDKLEPQLSDFGLAIWGPETESFLTVSDVVGTFGYLAPEYFMYGKVSDKIDVYAFGVVLLELLSGRKPVGFETLKGQESLVMQGLN